MKPHLACLLIVLLLCFPSAGPAEVSAWTKKSDMPTARYGLSSSVVNERIYAIGGTTDWQYVALPTVEEYDPAVDTWVRKSDMPTPRWSLCTSVVDGKIYAIGGTTGKELLSTVEMYDPAADTWTKKASMSVPRASFSTSVMHGKIYAIGGYTPIDFYVTNTSSVEEYDPERDQWVWKTDMPIAKNGLSASAINNKIYVIGGMDDDCAYLSLVEEYDPITDNWVEKTSMPSKRVSFSTTTANGKIYVLGGWSGISFLSTAEAYDPIADKWTAIDDMETPKSDLSVSAVKGKLYAIGGESETRVPLSTVEEYDTGIINGTTNTCPIGKLSASWGYIKKGHY